MKRKPSGRFTLTGRTLKSHGIEYQAFEVEGRLHGRRIRRQFKSRDEAIGEKNALEVEAANAGGEVRARLTRLSPTSATGGEK
jgi:hypothetical protein